MTGGDDILYLITLGNLEIHLVIGLCCFEVFVAKPEAAKAEALQQTPSARL